jgi:hypothetical protein
MAGGNNYYLGDDPVSRLGDTPRFFYGLRKNENGSLFLARVDQVKDKGIITINNPGLEENNYTDFETGVDFFEGIDVNHNPVYENLNYTQYRWDDRPMFYYINEEGELVVRVNEGYVYDNGSSEE